MKLPLHRLLWRLAIILLAVAALNACQQPEGPSFLATDVTGARFGRDFNLTDDNGNAVRLANFRGKVVAIFFGFTHCPDVCPTTLAELSAALDKLGPDARRVQVLFVTVDPERDTPEVLRNYLTAFNPAFLGLTGSEAQIAAVAKEFKVIYQKVKGQTADSYSVDHAAGTFIFDPKGRLRLYVGYGQGTKVFAHDIAELLKQG